MSDSYAEAVKFTGMGIGILCLAFAIPEIVIGSPADIRASQGAFLAAAVIAFGGGILFGAYGWLVRRYW